ncbi:hypothetical protein EHW89_08555 [Streptococcus periodonticum]|uniref:Integrase catalytic domain-containing protein n=1 Tax=Streptococcus periodonticum TaxID=2490633 RepID=A0A3Q9F3Z5_9STRE|nr:hypothetical protein EHW89_08555 [Streptococcus periodonticum]
MMMLFDDDYYFKDDSYNHKRIKTKLKGLSPVQYKTKSFQQLFWSQHTVFCFFFCKNSLFITLILGVS